ncbi:hypothetical protein TWF694_008060 [Orbilia ellipsospora]|uniref:Extracellular membrane protein CFEM domain-containing protein n=1 Tax=Orbilia ellipsospora TaxID=2528407 RepID=A0AAV9XIB3_9PEZI
MLFLNWNSYFSASSLILGLAFILPQVAAQNPTAVISLIVDPAYSSAYPCVQTCLFYNGGATVANNAPEVQDIGRAVGCGPYAKNDCYCAKALSSSATVYISSFVSAYCEPTQTNALEQALSIYGKYCSTANTGADALPTASTTFETGLKTVTVATNGPTASTVDTSGLSEASKVALGVGLGLGMAVLIFLFSIFFCLWRRGKRGELRPNGAGGGKK